MLVNLTPHKVDVCGDSGCLIISIAPSGSIARISVSSSLIGCFDSIPVYSTKFGSVTGLDGIDVSGSTKYIVSSLILGSLSVSDPRLNVLCAPGELMRNTEGCVIGCKGLRMRKIEC